LSNIEKPFCTTCDNEYESDTKFCPYDGTELIIRILDPLLGKVFDSRYRIIHKIGEGGMGAVYKALQISTEKTVAIKVISTSLSENAQTIKRFEREVKLQSRLEHPNIVNVIDFSRSTDGGYYFVMGFAEGKSLKQMILKIGQLSLDLFFELGLQMCNGIIYAHQLGIVHRDLKGDNIVVISLEHEKIVKILDFGIAKAFQEVEGATTGLTNTNALLGTPAYMSPEQAKGDIKSVGPQSDIYSLGVIFYQMLSGELPFKSDTPWGMIHKHIYEKPASLRKINSKVSKKLDVIILRCLEKDMAKRYPSAVELKADLEQIQPPKTKGSVSVGFDDETVMGPTNNKRTFPKKGLFITLVIGVLFFEYYAFYRPPPIPPPIHIVERYYNSENQEASWYKNISHRKNKIILRLSIWAVCPKNRK